MEYKDIDVEFIDYWEKKYDQIENDELEYLNTLRLVSSSVKNFGFISEQIFKRIIEWKSPRTKNIIQYDFYEEKYIPVIKMCIVETSIKKKIELLDSLDGIGVPIASTIIHFIEPEVFPIIDIRTIGCLNHFRYNIHSSENVRDYIKYYNIMHSIRNNTKKTLREIDRALFSYHKINKCGEKKMQCKSKSNSIEAIIQRHYNMSANQLLDKLADKYIDNSKQREIFKTPGVWQKVKFNYLAGYILTQRSKYVFSPLEIIEVICELIEPIGEIENDSLLDIVLTRDIHLQAKRDYNNGYPCLEKIGRGKYKFVGFINT